MYPHQPWKSYRQIATQTAPPGQLVLMLFDGVLRRLQRALEGFAQTDPAEANMAIHNNLLRAQEIIRELDQALDMEQGGQIANTLRNLYRYFDHLLSRSNTRKEQTGIEEVVAHVTILRDAWAEMLLHPQKTTPELESSLVAA